MQGDAAVFDRFDLFNAKYKLGGSAELKEIFLGYSNFINGKHLAAMCKIAHRRLEETDHLFAEWRISVLGANMGEWAKIASFIVDNDLHKLTHQKWMVQNPRIYSSLQGKAVKNYGEVLKNFFSPLFEATLNPAANEKLDLFLSCLSGFDSVDDESIADLELDATKSSEWTRAENPGYAYQVIKGIT